MTAPSRIVVALDPAAPYASGSDRLRQWILASTADLESEIVGLFVEDARLLSHARSSLAREVEIGGTERALDFAALERQLRASSEAIRRLFDSIVGTLAGPRSFRVMRGEVIDEIEREAAESQALIVSVAKTPFGARPWWGAEVHRLTCASCRTIVFVRDGTTPANAALVALLTEPQDAESVRTITMRIARAEHLPVTAIVVAGDPESARPIVDRAAKVLRTDLGQRLVTVAEPTAAALQRAIGTRDSGTLIMATRGTESEAQLVRELLATTSWNLILTRPYPPS